MPSVRDLPAANKRVRKWDFYCPAAYHCGLWVCQLCWCSSGMYFALWAGHQISPITILDDYFRTKILSTVDYFTYILVSQTGLSHRRRVNLTLTLSSPCESLSRETALFHTNSLSVLCRINRYAHRSKDLGDRQVATHPCTRTAKTTKL